MTYTPASGPPLTTDELIQNVWLAEDEKPYWSFGAQPTGMPFTQDWAEFLQETYFAFVLEEWHQHPGRSTSIPAAWYLDFHPYTNALLKPDLNIMNVSGTPTRGPSTCTPHAENIRGQGLISMMISSDFWQPTLTYEGVARLTDKDGFMEAETLEGKWGMIEPEMWFHFPKGSVHKSPDGENLRFVARAAFN